MMTNIDMEKTKLTKKSCYKTTMLNMIDFDGIKTT